jgi:hypothetical protein
MPTSPVATPSTWAGHVTVGGSRLAVRERGGDEPVVLLHPASSPMGWRRCSPSRPLAAAGWLPTTGAATAAATGPPGR